MFIYILYLHLNTYITLLVCIDLIQNEGKCVTVCLFRPMWTPQVWTVSCTKYYLKFVLWEHWTYAWSWACVHIRTHHVPTSSTPVNTHVHSYNSFCEQFYILMHWYIELDTERQWNSCFTIWKILMWKCVLQNMFLLTGSNLLCKRCTLSIWCFPFKWECEKNFSARRSKRRLCGTISDSKTLSSIHHTILFNHFLYMPVGTNLRVGIFFFASGCTRSWRVIWTHTKLNWIGWTWTLTKIISRSAI